MSNAADVVDAALLSGSYNLASEAALWILRNAEFGRGDVVESARHVLGLSGTSTISVTPPTEMDLRVSARTLKCRLLENPRDGITATELSRIYLLAGQSAPAVKAIERASKLCPDNRFVLRSAAQLFTNLGDPERALKIIWKSDAVRSDPWIQAAEVATADACGQTPKYGTTALKNLLSDERPGIRFSELAVGLASLELKAGTKRRKLRGLLAAGLNSGTENSLAQVLWIQENFGVSVHAETFVNKIAHADEAQSRVAYESGDYELALKASTRWLIDQQFSVDAARNYMFISSIHLDKYEDCIQVGKAALRLHPKDYTILNGQMFALAMSGRLTEARGMLERLEVFKNDEAILPFIYAGRGLIHFRSGQVQSGREMYAKAIEVARAAKKPTLVANASFYWLEQEAASHSMTEDEIRGAVASVDRQVLEMPKSLRKDSSPSWNARKLAIEKSFTQKDLFVTGTIKNAFSGKDIVYSISKKLAPSYLSLK